MRKTKPLIIAAALLTAVPAFAQATNEVAPTDPTAVTNATDPALDNVVADPAMNGLATDPAGMPPAGAADPAATNPAMATPVGEQEDDDGFPWGVLGLLGLLGLIPRKNRGANNTGNR